MAESPSRRMRQLATLQSVRRWTAWQLQRVLPDPGQSFQRIELDQALFTLLPWRRDERVLDVGCELGRYTRMLAGRVGRIIGLDLNESTLRRWQDDRVIRIAANAQAIPFADASFDTILCHN